MTFKTLSVLEKIDKIRGALYKLNDSGIAQIGVIAQEIRAVFPEAVSGEETEGRYLGVSYNAIASIALQGVKELNDAVKSLRTKVETMFAWFSPSGDSFNIQGNVCVDDVCVTKDQFKQMLLNQAGVAVNGSVDGSVQADAPQTQQPTVPPASESGDDQPGEEVEEAVVVPEDETELQDDSALDTSQTPPSEESADTIVD